MEQNNKDEAIIDHLNEIEKLIDDEEDANYRLSRWYAVYRAAHEKFSEVRGGMMN